jgi:hypothetical protein
MIILIWDVKERWIYRHKNYIRIILKHITKMIKITHYSKSNGSDERRIEIDKTVENQKQLETFRQELEAKYKSKIYFYYNEMK